MDVLDRDLGVSGDQAVADPRVALRAERELIERRAYTDLLRLAEIRQQLDALDDDPSYAVWR